MTISAVGMGCDPADAHDYVQISDDAASMKKRAKKVAGSVFLKDW
jgi:hypothetical protein